jgi:hypothetical protein
LWLRWGREVDWQENKIHLGMMEGEKERGLLYMWREKRQVFCFICSCDMGQMISAQLHSA